MLLVVIEQQSIPEMFTIALLGESVSVDKRMLLSSVAIVLVMSNVVSPSITPSFSYKQEISISARYLAT